MFGDKIDIHDVQNSILNIKSTLTGVSQTIAASPIDISKKEELQSLVKQLEAAIAKGAAGPARRCRRGNGHGEGNREWAREHGDAQQEIDRNLGERDA